MRDLKYKIGDKVLIKCLDWYNKYKDEDGDVSCGEYDFVEGMKKFCSETLTISEDVGDGYFMLEDQCGYVWTDEMIEGLVEEEMPLDKAGQITDFEYEGLVYTLPDGYIFKDENGNVINTTKIVLEKKKKEYPKTYVECYKVLGYDDRETYCICHTLANERLFEALYRLKVCRDAYWKIAGDEMGLGKPWEPDWKKQDKKYIISVFEDTVIYFENETYNRNTVLSFPTEEMRDAFFNAFRDDIEKCKELL